MTEPDILEDPLALHAAVAEANARTRDAKRKYLRITRELFSSRAGKQWLALAMARHNFMGSVFSPEDCMSATAAAYRDGVRSVFSDILNAAAADGPGKNGPADPDEDRRDNDPEK